MTDVRRALCQRLVLDLLADYVAGTLPADDVTVLERHLQACPPCLAYVSSYRSTIGLAGAAIPEPPPELLPRLRAFLSERRATIGRGR